MDTNYINANRFFGGISKRSASGSGKHNAVGVVGGRTFQFTTNGSPRVMLSAIDRASTKKGFSVYEELNGLRVYTGFAKARIKNDEHDFVVELEPTLPRLWLLFPSVIGITGLLLGDVRWAVVALALAGSIYRVMKVQSRRKAFAQMTEFKQLVDEIVRHENAVSSHFTITQ